ncbi:MAG TPA: PEP/pyruvate-binding domain-containing protein, partial [Nannocystis sp.]
GDPATGDDTGAASTSDAGTTDASTDTTTGEPSACAEAEAKLGARVCAHEVADDATWSALSLGVDRIDQVRTGKYLAPARDDARLPALVLDVNTYELHYQFLRAAFPDRFPDLTPESYERMITDPAERELFAGSITEYRTATGERLFGYVAWDPQTDLATTVTCSQFQALHASLAQVVTVGPLAAVPTGELQRQVLADCDVPSYDATAAVDYEPYTTAVGFGTVRRYTPAELDAATQAAAYGFQDILVLQEAPLDIERVISGAVTGGRQAELSHLNVRSAARGTPNCYLRDAHARMAPWDGELVRLECGKTGLEVRAASPEEAQSWWDQLRPDPVEIPAPDLDWPEITPLLELPTATPDERLLGVRRYGAKGRNLATLYQRIDAALQIPGFLIPFHYYDAYLASQQWTVDLGAGPETLSLAAAIDRLLMDPQFRTDPALRRQRLDALYEAIRDGACDPALLADLHTRLLETFGADTVMVRFRSSSNAEDAPGFSGAGLYESTSACLADDLDADKLGPSRCDPSEPDERGVCRAVKKVWASLWLVRAFEEREWYGIDHHEAAMGILVDQRFGNEKANMVVFTGDPNLAGDQRILVNAQLGDLEVVSPEPGTWPEQTRLTMVDGAVTKIDRVRGSSELPEGQHVLSDAQLEQLGAHMWQIREVFPIDEPPPPDTAVLLDSEWKVRPDDTLVIKQVRPYLRRE